MGTDKLTGCLAWSGPESDVDMKVKRWEGGGGGVPFQQEGQQRFLRTEVKSLFPSLSHSAAPTQPLWDTLS